MGTKLQAGVAAVGTAWNTAFFSNLTVRPSESHAVSSSSFLYDVLPSSKTVSTFTGHAGMILDLNIAHAEAITVSELGRFVSAGNSETHQLGIVQASDQKWIAGPVSVDMASTSSTVLSPAVAYQPGIRVRFSWVCYTNWELVLVRCIIPTGDRL